MFDVGFTEIFLLAVISLMVLGPERLPKVARTVGGFVRKARTSWFALRRTLEAELSAAEMNQSIQSVKRELDEVSSQLNEIQEPADSSHGQEPTGPEDTPPKAS